MNYEIIDKQLPNISDTLVLEQVKGIVLHGDPEFFNNTADDIYEELLKLHEDDAQANGGYHYIVDGKKIYNTIGERYIARSLEEDNKPTYISKSLFGDTPNNNLISIYITVHEKQSYEETEITLIKFLVTMLKTYNLTAKDVWRGFDLSKQNYGPFHSLSKTIFEKYIRELEKFVPPIEGMEPNDPDGEPEAETFNTPEYPNEEDIEIESPYKEAADNESLPIDSYIYRIYKNNISNPRLYASKFQPWDKDREDAKIASSIEGDIQTKELPYGNTLQYKVTQNAPTGLDHCEQGPDFLEAIETPQDVVVEPIYPDLITPPGTDIHIADGFSETKVQSESTTPLTAEEFEKRQKTFDFSAFNNMKKETQGRPVNVQDPFPVDDQIKKLEEHFPKVKIDKVTYNIDDSNHPNDPVGRALAKNQAMTYDMVTEVAKRTEQRLVKIENNLSTVMRNMFRLSSRVNINCTYYGGQSVYGKYKCIRCLHDDRINDGAIVTIDQCMNCTRYEPILGQVYAILDETGSNVVQVMDDMQMSYMSLREYNNLSKRNRTAIKKQNAEVSNNPAEPPIPFIEDKWMDNEKEIKAKEEFLENNSEEQDKVESDGSEENTEEAEKEKEIVHGFKMDWTPVPLETQEPNINSYDIEDLKAEKKAIESTTEGVDRNMFIDSRLEAVEYESLEFDVKDYEFDNFGTGTSSSTSGSFGMGAMEVRNNILSYVNKAVALCQEGKAKYSQGYRYNHMDNALNGIHYWDCSSLTQKAYEAVGVSGVGTNTFTQYPHHMDKNGGLLIPLKDIDQALPGDMVWFTKGAKPDTREGLQNIDINGLYHVAIYMGDGKYGHSSYAHADSTKDINISEIANNQNVLCFGRPKALIDLDQQFGQGLSGNSHWSREFHGITDEWWNKAAVADGNVSSFVTNMEKYNYKDLIISISQEKGFDPYLTAAIIAVESSGDPRDNDAYAGLMQVQGHYGSTDRAGMKDNIEKGIDMILKKRTALKQYGWVEDNIHVLISAYNSGEGSVVRACGNDYYGSGTGPKRDLSKMLIPELGDALYTYMKQKQPSWNPVEKQTYGVKILRAYNLIYSNNYLGLPQENNNATYTGEFIRPVPHAVTSKFGPRIHPITGVAGTMHKGVDYGTPSGYTIKATAGGTVSAASYMSGYGNCVYVDHGKGYISRYAHMSSITVKQGDKVSQGQEVGKCGSTGNSTGPHLHFEIRLNDEPQDPEKLVKNY